MGAYVIAIDVGIKNVGLCVYDISSHVIVYWDNVELCGGKYMPAHNVSYVRAFVERFQHYFANAITVLVERQMRCNMRIIEALLEHTFFDRCVVIAPRAVKMHYPGLSTRNYRNNKQKAVEWTQYFLEHNARAFAPEVQKVFGQLRKRDDLADALLLLVYYLDTYSNKLIEPQSYVTGLPAT